MSDVHFRLRTPQNYRPGVAIAEIWRAFSETKFIKQRFILPYGNDECSQTLELAQGEYWLQIKFPDGRFLNQLVSVSMADGPVEIDVNGFNPLGHSDESVGFPLEKNDDFSTYSFDRAGFQNFDLPQLPDSEDVPDAYSRYIRHFSRSTTFTLENFNEEIDFSGTNSTFYATRLSGTFEGLLEPDVVNRGAVSSRYLRKFLWSASRTSVDGQINDEFLISPIPLREAPMYWPNKSAGRANVGGASREFLLIRAANGVRNPKKMFISVPDNWVGGSAKLKITRQESTNHLPLRATIEIDDPKVNSLLQYINTGDLRSAFDLIQDSVELLYAKFNNPYAAAAAGYVLVFAAPRTLRVPWHEWIGNLGRYFENIPDGDILHATLLLQRGDVETPIYDFSDDYERYFPEGVEERVLLAAKLTLKAVHKGPPLFRSGLTLLASNLNILTAARLPDYYKVPVSEAAKVVTWLSMAVDPREPFTVFHFV